MAAIPFNTNVDAGLLAYCAPTRVRGDGPALPKVPPSMIDASAMLATQHHDDRLIFSGASDAPATTTPGPSWRIKSGHRACGFSVRGAQGFCVAGPRPISRPNLAVMTAGSCLTASTTKKGASAQACPATNVRSIATDSVFGLFYRQRAWNTCPAHSICSPESSFTNRSCWKWPRPGASKPHLGDAFDVFFRRQWDHLCQYRAGLNTPRQIGPFFMMRRC